MNKFYSFLVVGLFGFFQPSHIWSQNCSETNVEKIMLVGDSWAFFMNVDNTINDVLNYWGHSGYKYYTNLILSENGAKIKHLLEKPEKTQEIQNQLLARPNIKYVHLSIGGNDLLGNWKYQSFSTFQTDSLINDILNKLDSIIDFIKGVRPDVSVIWGGDAYPNFEEVLTQFDYSLGPIPIVSPSDHPFYSTWEKMEFPPNVEINNMLNRFSDSVVEIYQDDPRVVFVPSMSITQHTFGQNVPLGVLPGGTYAPGEAPLPYGFTEYPSPQNSMRHYADVGDIEVKDCFHLSKTGFRDLIGYTTQKFYHKALMDDKYFLAKNSEANGSVTSNGNVSAQLFLGENEGNSYATFLNFDTQGELPFVPE